MIRASRRRQSLQVNVPHIIDRRRAAGEGWREHYASSPLGLRRRSDQRWLPDVTVGNPSHVSIDAPPMEHVARSPRVESALWGQEITNPLIAARRARGNATKSYVNGSFVAAATSKKMRPRPRNKTRLHASVRPWVSRIH